MSNLSPKTPTQIAGILGRPGVITQAFGNYNPGVERYSGGVNRGTDIAVPAGTSAYLPPGSWQVEQAFNDAKYSGSNNPQHGINSGYGNSVLVKNTQTGEKLRYSHLLQALAQAGQTIQGGQQIGYTGATGNTAGRTGNHLDLEYYNPAGQISNVLKSAYGQYVNGTPQGGNMEYAPSQGGNYAQLLQQKAQQLFGNRLVAVTTDANVAKSYAGKKGISVQRISI